MSGQRTRGRKSAVKDSRDSQGDPGARHWCPEEDKRPRVHPDPRRPDEGLSGERYRTPTARDAPEVQLSHSPHAGQWADAGTRGTDLRGLLPTPETQSHHEPRQTQAEDLPRDPRPASSRRQGRDKAQKPPWRPGEAEEKRRPTRSASGPWGSRGTRGER